MGTQKDMECDMKIGVGLFHHHKGFIHRNVDTQFLLYLTRQTGLKGLIIFPFTTWEFPETPEIALSGP